MEVVPPVTTDIETYFFKADKLEEDLQENYCIEWPTRMKITQAEEEMYRSDILSNEELMAWGKKNRADKMWVHLQAYFKDRWTATMRYKGNTPHKHGFEIAASAEQDRGEHTKCLVNNLCEVAVAATTDKEHIQQMTTQNDALLNVVRKQQAQTCKQQTQIDELLKQNSQLINKIGTSTDTGGTTSAGKENTHRVRYRGNRNNNGNRNTNNNDTGSDAVASTNNRTNNIHKCAVSPLCLHKTADFSELDKKKAKDLIIGQLCSNETLRGQVTIKSQG